MKLLYNLFVHSYSFFVALASLFNTKAALLHKGRIQTKQLFAALEKNADQWLWFHAASLGEFEQGRPVIEAIRKQYPHFKILLSFFSPSGYEIRKNYPLADLVIYLPADTPKQARIVFNKLNVSAFILIKYEFWFNHIAEAHAMKVPVFLVSGRFRKDQLFFTSWGSWFRKHLFYFDHFFVQDENSALLLQSVGIHQASITGDTRFDRVKELTEQAIEFPEVVAFKNDHILIVAGSTWPEDENILFELLPTLPANCKLLIAPHDISEAHLLSIEKKSPVPAERFSLFTNKPVTRLLIIDSIGKLSQLYQYARFAYIGGGFGKAIHNIQEAVTWGCPVVFGPNYKKFSEAVDLIELGGGFTINNSKEMQNVFSRLLEDNMALRQASEVCRSYVERQAGATSKVIDGLSKILT